MKEELKLKVGRYHAKPLVLETDSKQYQGIVLLYEGEHHHSERHVVPTFSRNYHDALENAKALAHKILEKRINDGVNEHN